MLLSGVSARTTECSVANIETKFKRRLDFRTADAAYFIRVIAMNVNIRRYITFPSYTGGLMRSALIVWSG